MVDKPMVVPLVKEPETSTPISEENKPNPIVKEREPEPELEPETTTNAAEAVPIDAQKTSPEVVERSGGVASDTTTSAGLSTSVPIVPKPGEELQYVLTIQKCRDLLAGDRTGLSDPYVKVRMGSKQVHKTKHILKT